VDSPQVDSPDEDAAHEDALPVARQPIPAPGAPASSSLANGLQTAFAARQSAAPPSRPASLEAIVTFGGRSPCRCLALPPPR
jgi:hypothetical protein